METISQVQINTREDGEYVSVVFNQGGEEVDVVGIGDSTEITDARSALYALSDVILFQDYDEDLSEFGFHVKKNKAGLLSAVRATNIAVVSTEYAGNYFDGLGVSLPTIAGFPHGWAVLNRRNRKFYFTPVNGDGDGAVRARKHDFIDEILEGVSLDIHVRGFNANKDENGMGVADKVIHSWTLPEDEAQAYRIQGFQKAQQKRAVRKEYRRVARQEARQKALEENNGGEKAPKGLQVAGHFSKVVTLKAGTVYAWQYENSQPTTLSYSPFNSQSQAVILNLNEKGWTFANSRTK